MLLDEVPNSGEKNLEITLERSWSLQTSERGALLHLTLFFLMFRIDPPENIRKPKGFLYFQGDYKGEKG